MEWAALWPWRGAALAFVLSLGMALAAGALRRPRLAALAAGVGVLGGWWLTFGLLTATPRQMPERLPLLMLGLVLLAGLGGGMGARFPGLQGGPKGRSARRFRGGMVSHGLPPVLAGLGALGAGWWMAGAPLISTDLARAVLPLGLIASATFVMAWFGTGRWRGVVAAGALLSGVAGAGAAGPGVVLGAVVLAAALGAAASRTPPATPLAALPLAGGMAALAAVPVIARGGHADWAAAAAPLLALVGGAALAARVPRLGVVGGGVVAAVPAVLLAWWLR